MASDSLRQIGNYIKDTRKDTDFGLKRYHAIIPQIERARDVFDSEIPFKMTFKTEPGHEKVSLNLNFNLPPPLSQCNADCVKASCQTFDVTPGDHLLTLDNPYNEGSVAVFVDFVQSLPSGFEEVNPGAGTVFVQGSETTSTITICYTYGDCGADFNPCPDLLDATPKAFVGLAPIFMDRFDRQGPPENPAGGCGYWDTSGSQTVNFSNGVASVNAVAEFEPFGVINATQISSDNIEALFWLPIDFITAPILAIGFNGYGPSSQLIISNASGNFTCTGSMPIQYRLSTVDESSSTNSIKTDGAASKGPTVIATAETGSYFVRVAQISGTGLFLRMWKEGTEEPSTWDFTVGVEDFTGPPGAVNATPYLPNVHGLGITCSFLKALTIWGEPGRGGWKPHNTFGDDPLATSWNFSHCYSNPDGLTRFQHCDPEVINKDRDTTSHDVGDDEPAMNVGLSWPHFIADTTGLGRLKSTGSHVRSYRNKGNAQSVIISGEISVSNIYDLGFNVTFYSYDYGESEPSVFDDVFVGMAVGEVFAPGDNDPQWAPFEFTFPVGGDGKFFQWGCAFSGGASTVEGILGAEAHYPQFLAVNNYGIGISLKNLVVKAVGAIWCSTHPFCPDSVDDYNARCGDVTDISGTSYPSFCSIPPANVFSSQSDFYTPIGGSQVEWRRDQGVSLTQSGGVQTIGFSAFGITTGGSDGRCPRQFAVYDTATMTRSMSFGNGEIIISSPFDCTDVGGEIYYEFRVSSVNLGSWSSTDGTQYPELNVDLRDDNGFGAQIFIGDSGFSNYLYIFGTQNGTYTLPLPVTTTDWYSVRFQVFKNDGDTDQTVRIRIWKVGDTEPSSWLIEDQTAFGPINLIELEASYSEYIDDNTFVQFRNVTITGESF